MRIGNAKTMKSLNEGVVLSLFINNDKLSASEIVNITNLYPSTVSQIIKKFRSRNLIKKIGVGESLIQGGRRPVYLSLNPNIMYFLGIELTPRFIRYLIMDFKFNILEQKEILQKEKITYNELFDNLSLCIKKITHQEKNIRGIGIGISGIVSSDTGKVYKTTVWPEKNNGKFSKDIKKIAQNRLVVIDNDANLGALSEYISFQPDYPESLVFFQLNLFQPGIGSGIILDNNIYKGYNNSAGEVDLSFKELIKYNKKSSKDIALLLSKDNKLIQDIVDKVADKIESVTSFMDPEVIIIGGDRIFEKTNIYNKILKRISKTNNRIEKSKHKNYTIAYGAAISAHKRYLSEMELTNAKH